MVTVTGYQARNSEGKVFFALILNSGIQLIKSKSGQFYATAKRASLPSTFDEKTCKALIGEEFKGSITSIPCDEYVFTVPETGEEIVLNQRNEYCPEENNFIGNLENLLTEQVTN